MRRPLQDGLVAPGLGEQLAERPEGDALAVGRAAADEDGRRACGLRNQLAREPRLPDAGLADDRQVMHATAARDVPERRAELPELARSTDQRCVVAAGQGGGLGIDQLEPESRELPARALHAEARGDDCMRKQRVCRRLSEQHLAGGSTPLEPPARRHQAAADAAPTGVACDHLARVDSDPQLDPQPAAELAPRTRRARRTARLRRGRRADVVLGTPGCRTPPSPRPRRTAPPCPRDARSSWKCAPRDAPSARSSSRGRTPHPARSRPRPRTRGR